MSKESLKYKTKRGIYWTFFNQFTNYGLSFVVGIILARILSPSDYGIIALPSIFMCIASVFIESGFGTAMIRKKELNNNDLSTAFIYSASVGFLCYVIMFLCAPLIADFYDQPVLTRLVRISSLIFIWNPLATPQIITLKRKLDFKTIAKISVTTKIVGSAVGICMAVIGYGLWSLVAMNVVSSFCNFFLMWINVRWVPSLKWSKESFKYLWGFGNKLVASALLDTTYNNLTPLIVGKFFSVSELGNYNRALGYAQLPAQQGSSIIQQVTFPVLSKIQDDNKTLATSYRRMLKDTAFIIFPVMTLLSALARPLVILLITEKWEPCIILLQILCFSMMWYPVHAINLNLLQVKGRSDLFLKLEVIKKVIGLSIMACTLPFGLIYFVAAGIVNSLIALVINTYYTGKLIDVGFVLQMRDLLPIFVLSCLSFASALGFTHLVSNMWVQLFCGGLIGVAIYIGGAFILKFPELKDVKYMLQRK